MLLCRRRVLEDARAQEERLDPSWTQSRNFGKLNWQIRRTDERWLRRMIIAARRDECDRAFVLALLRVRVDALVQPRGNTQREGPEKRAQNSGGNDRARRYRLFPGETESHAREDCAFKCSGATEFRFHSYYDVAPAVPATGVYSAVRLTPKAPTDEADFLTAPVWVAHAARVLAKASSPSRTFLGAVVISLTVWIHFRRDPADFAHRYPVG